MLKSQLTMRFKMIEFLCSSCGQRFDFLAEGETEQRQQKRPCDFCDGVAEKVISAPGLKLIVYGNHDYKERHQQQVRARNKQHWAKKGKDEAVDRERAILKRYEP